MCKRRIVDLSTNSGRPADTTVTDSNGFLLEWGGVDHFFLCESQSRLYPHMRAKFWRGPSAVSKKVSFKFLSRLWSAILFFGLKKCRFLLCRMPKNKSNTFTKIQDIKTYTSHHNNEFRLMETLELQAQHCFLTRQFQSYRPTPTSQQRNIPRRRVIGSS